MKVRNRYFCMYPFKYAIWLILPDWHKKTWMSWLSATSLVGMLIKWSVGALPQHCQLIWYLIATKSNTFLEQVPILSKKFDLTTWARHKSTGSLVTPCVETSNTSMCSWQEQYQLICFLSLHITHLVGPTCSFILIYVTRTTATGKHGMWAMALSNDAWSKLPW
jgi:hypothetical protein